MYDGSTKEIQDVQVGDVVKSYQPIGMPNTDLNFAKWNTDDLAGSFFSGSVVVGKNESEASFYYTISGSNNQQYQRHQLASTFVFDSGSNNYRFRPGWDLQPGDKLFDKDGNEITIVSKEDTFVDNPVTFYSLDVEDIDTYFSSDILVHNLPKKD
jgi:hypothetical protein